MNRTRNIGDVRIDENGVPWVWDGESWVMTRYCQKCQEPIDDGWGVGFVARHGKTEAHVEAIKAEQAEAKAMLAEINERITEDKERRDLRRQLELEQELDRLEP